MKKQLYKFEVEDEKLSGQEINRLTRKKAGKGSDKKSLFFFIIISLGLLSFVSMYFYRGISSPFKFETPEWVKESLQDPDQKEANTIVELRGKDTDGDGLNDFEEIYQFNTSVFLEDTDSDGYSDYEEVSSENDPLCPSGQECGLLRLITPKTKIADVVETANIDPSVDLEQAVLADFRSALIEGGVPQEEVDKLTDDDLINLYEAMSEETDIVDATDTSQFTAQEVRLFLLAQPGADAGEINNLTDEELINIGNQLMGNAVTSQ